MGRVRAHAELRVFREAFDLAMRVFRVTRSFPDDERFGLSRQVRDSGRSVAANVAEAWRRRHYPAALAAKLIDAEAEATETRVHLRFARACGYLSLQDWSDLDRAYDRLIARLAVMRRQPEAWAPRPRPSPLDPRGHADEPRKAGRPAAPGHPPPADATPLAGPPGPRVPREPRSTPKGTAPHPGGRPESRP